MYEPQGSAAIFQVVVNHEDQHSLWPLDRDLPAGWRAQGFLGTHQECVAHITELWTDIRPLSLRQKSAT